MKLLKVHGLCDVLRAWYLKVKDVLEKAGARKSKFDDAIFYWYSNNKLASKTTELSRR